MIGRLLFAPLILGLPYLLSFPAYGQAPHGSTQPSSSRARVVEPAVRARANDSGDDTDGAETRTSKKADGTLVTWTRDRKFPRLGEAWRDPTGTVWGDIVKTKKGIPDLMTYPKAIEYCKSIGATLPAGYDFASLRVNMGAKKTDEPYGPYFGPREGYTPQVLPYLTYTDNGETHDRDFWASCDSVPDLESKSPACYFRGKSGRIDQEHPDSKNAVRCVVQARFGKGG